MFPIAEVEDVEWGEVTIALILVNILVYMLELALGPALVQAGEFVPAHPVWYRWLTSQFLHGGLFHIGGNMWALWIFGHRVEQRLGKRFLPFYLAGGCCANLAQWALDPSSTIGCIGASGAIAAVLGTYAVLFPKARLRFWQPIAVLPSTYTLSALIFGAFFLVTESRSLSADLSGTAGMVAHGAHLGGLVFGAAVGWLIKTPRDEAAAVEATAFDRAADLDDPQSAATAAVEALQRGVPGRLSPRTALAVGDKLAAARRWRPARAWLESVAAARPEEPAGAYALLLLGYVHSEGLRDPGAALQCYEAAAVHPRAEPSAAAQARERAQAARASIKAAAWDGAASMGEAAVILMSWRPLTDPRGLAADAIVAAAGLRPWLAGRGIFAAGTADAARLCAARLREATIPAGAVAVERLSASAAAHRISRLEPLAEGLLLDDARLLRWSDCLLVAGQAIDAAKRVPKAQGLLDVGLERSDGTTYSLVEGVRDEDAYEESRELSFSVQIVARGGERWCWASPAAEARERRRRLALSILDKAPVQTSINETIDRWALDENEPAHWRYGGFEHGEPDLAWAAEAARLL